jgi:hypothetical protein
MFEIYLKFEVDNKYVIYLQNKINYKNLNKYKK